MGGAQTDLATLAKHWRIVVACVLVAIAVAAGVTLTLAPTYQAHSQLFVSAASGQNTIAQLVQGGNFSQDRVKSYAQLATSPEVTRPVARALGSDYGAGRVARSVSVEVPPSTVLINITAKDRTPEGAARIANAVGDQLSKLIEQVETPGAGGKSPIQATVVRSASAPGQPTSPQPALNVVLGLLVGLGVGIGAAYLRVILDTSIKDAETLSQVTQFPVLASIRRDPSESAEPILGDLHGPRSEDFRQLRTNLRFASVDSRLGTVLVTSAVPGEGKSSVTGNLAVTLSQLGVRVCVVDCDLRQPSLADYFGLVGEVGVTTLLIGEADITDVVQPARPGLDVITSGAIPPNPSELLESRGARGLLDQLSAHYDMVIIDSPPLLPVTDATVLATEVDAVVMVVRASKTSRAQALQAAQSVRSVGARVLGTVLNMTPARTSRAGGYDYGYVSEQPKREKRNEPVLAATGDGVNGVDGVDADAARHRSASQR